MLNEIQKNELSERAKIEVQKILNILNIDTLNNDNYGELLDELENKVIYMVNDMEEGISIDHELLEIYDLLTDIILDNEENIDYLNELFLH